MIKNIEGLVEALIQRGKELGAGCEKVFLAVSGGVDSSLLAAILCQTFGSENVVGLYRDIRSNPKHLEDVRLLQKNLGFKLIAIDANYVYDMMVKSMKTQFQKAGLSWVDENDPSAEELGFTNAFASLKSRMTTPFAGFISKAIDQGSGRIFGTGNGEEDGILRYFDKFGDGAVDNNILNGLTKAEVRQLARYLGVPEQIVQKTPSADLEASGDAHNDEDQLSAWAQNMGYPIKISYGTSDGFSEGNIAWAWKEDLRHGIVTGKNSKLSAVGMVEKFGYTSDETQTILFLRKIEKQTRHKVDPIPGLERTILREKGLVD